ncbi:hypothetical protein [Chryseobacterium taiwanense]|uniref:Cohesin domain-containing protein n=1 Tax=Chryseobacterium taiwanense TaxID=363331 RepID=A0A0B4EEK2_9FLAO|nr:hypothetical protein [Chryseobacterium taiwanense]KIC65088.1 hypothetical protein RM51_01155 [Chryseobacterium taiwanense]
MKKDIRIEPLHGNVSVNIKITGLIGAGYYLDVFEKNSNNVVFSYSGTNVFDYDDMRVLPNSSDMNLGRVLMLNTTVVSIDDNQDEEKKFTIRLQIIQNGNIVDEAVISDKIKKQHKNFLTLVKLI